MLKTQQKHSKNYYLIPAILILSFLAGGYIYLDHKADRHAQQLLETLSNHIQSTGNIFHYQSVDSSLLSRSITISDVSIKGSENEPDISFGQVIVKGLDWKTLFGKESDNHFPLDMSVILNEGEIYLKPSLTVQDRNIQALAEHLGDKLKFSLSLNYHYNDTGIFSMQASSTLENNFRIGTQLQLDNMQWLTMLNDKAPHDLASEIMKSTLTQLDMTFINKGIIEQLRKVAVKRTGMSERQLTQDAIKNMQKLRANAEKTWGPLFLPMIDELIKFAQKPQKLHLSIHPATPIDSDAVILAMRGGNAGILELIKKSNFILVAN